MSIDYMNEFLASENDYWVNKVAKRNKEWLQQFGLTPYSYVDGKFCWMNSPEGDLVKELPALYAYFVGCKVINRPYRHAMIGESL